MKLGLNSEASNAVTSELEPRSKRLRGSAWSFLVGAVSGLAVQILAVRVLGVQTYGTYAAVLGMIAITEICILNRGGELAFGVLGEAWSDGRRARIDALTRRLYRADLTWVCSGYVALVLVAAALGEWLGWPLEWVAILALGLPLHIGYGADKAILIVAGRVLAHARMESWIALGSAAIACFGLLAFGIDGFLWAYPAAIVLKVALIRFLAWQFRRENALSYAQERTADRIDLAGQLTMTLRNLSSAGSENADVIIVNAVAGDIAAAHYRIAKSLASLPARAFGPLWSSVRPELVRYWFASDRRPLRRLLLRPLPYVLTGLGVLLPGLWWLAPELLRVAYKVDSEGVIPALTVLTIGAFALAGGAGWYRFIMLVDSDKRRSLRWSLAILLWTVVGGLVAAKWGALAMAAVAAAAQIGLAAAAFHWILREIKRDSRQ